MMIDPQHEPWSLQSTGVSEDGILQVSSVGRLEDQIVIEDQSFLRPGSLLLLKENEAKAVTLKSASAHFRADDLVVEQRHSTSKDGTKIP
jgi:prolyl oligopeptidase PreP (S9A serine peptidase family)